MSAQPKTEAKFHAKFHLSYAMFFAGFDRKLARSAGRCLLCFPAEIVRLYTIKAVGIRMQACCETQIQAVSKGHDACFIRLLPGPEENYPHLGDKREVDLFSSMCLALRKGHARFADQIFRDYPGAARLFAIRCTYEESSNSANQCARDEATKFLEYVISAAPDLDLGEEEDEYLGYLVKDSVFFGSPGCLRVLLESGADWIPYLLLFAALYNRLDILDVVLDHHRREKEDGLSCDWCPRLPGQAACVGNVRFLKRIFDAGCPQWKIAKDGEPWLGPDWESDQEAGFVGEYIPVGKVEPEFFEHWALVVSDDLARSGPVLLYAFQRGAPMTLRMQCMLGEVWWRVLTLLCCFHKASSLAQAPGESARKWQAMAGLPKEIIQNIATLARISIFVTELVE